MLLENNKLRGESLNTVMNLNEMTEYKMYVFLLEVWEKLVHIFYNILVLLLGSDTTDRKAAKDYK